MVGWDRILAQVIEKKCSGAPGEIRTPDSLLICLEDTKCKTLSAASGVAYRGTRHLSRSWIGPKINWNFWLVR